jgi:hypothetical protein
MEQNRVAGILIAVAVIAVLATVLYFGMLLLTAILRKLK